MFRQQLYDFRLYLLVPYENDTAVIGIADKMIAPLTVSGPLCQADPAQAEIRCGGMLAYVKDGALCFEERSVGS